MNESRKKTGKNKAGSGTSNSRLKPKSGELSKKALSRAEVDEIILRLKRRYPHARCMLDYRTPFELLIAALLSAQTTDERVNQVSPALFESLKKPSDIYDMEPEEIEELIKPIGLYKSKARAVYECCVRMAEVYGDEVPSTFEDLTSLRGVGRKVANVILSTVFGEQRIAVDTHVQRVSQRIGLVGNSDVTKIEYELMDLIDESDWTIMHHVMIFHGRTLCKARGPLCEACPIEELCLYRRTGSRARSG